MFQIFASLRKCFKAEISKMLSVYYLFQIGQNVFFLLQTKLLQIIDLILFSTLTNEANIK